MNLIGKISTVRIKLAIGMVSASIIAFQLALMQILSYIQWYHFAYMIISIAMLGFGFAGTFMIIFRKKLQQNYYWIFPFLLIITAVLISNVVIISNFKAIRFDSLLIFQDFSYNSRLLITYIIFFLPFFTGSLAIGMSFLKFSEQIGKIYFANLVGSGIGGIVALLLMQWLFPWQLPVSVAVIALFGGLIVLPKNSPKLLLFIIIAPLFVLFIASSNFFKLKLSEYKDISKTLLLPDAKIEYEKNSPYGLVQIVSSPVIRYAPGLSFNYQKPFPVRKAVFNNGDWNGYLIDKKEDFKNSILNYTSHSLPYKIEKIDNVLIINAGTGTNIELALSNNIPVIIAAEVNPQIYNLLQNSFTDQNNVKLHQIMARTLLVIDTVKYDLIQLPIIGSFFGNSGLNAVEPRYELSIEALQKMWDKLTDNGMICLSCWMDYPVRNPYRLLASISQLLEEKNIKQSYKHIIVVRSWSAITILLKKTEFTNDQTKMTEQFCENLMFDPLMLPENTEIKKGKYNILENESFFENIKKILSVDKEKFFNEYPFRIRPISDNKPFFSQNIRLNSLQQLMISFGKRSIPYFELGYMLVLLTFIQIIIVAAVFIILPLLRKQWKSKYKTWLFVYFGGIGLAYMFIEIVFIQQFTFYIGQPIYAAATCISILLMSSAYGSYYSTSLHNTKKTLFSILLLIVILLLLHTIFLSKILSSSIAMPFGIKILVSIILIGITGFLLGIPFPMGIKYLSKNKQDDIPWAWAFNSYFSVISSTMAIIISVEIGFVWVLLLAAIFYAFASLMSLRQNN